MQLSGRTASEAMGRLEFRSLGSMRDNVDLLYTRILDGINSAFVLGPVCRRDGIRTGQSCGEDFLRWDHPGGEPQKVGTEASNFALKIAFLRAQRSQIAAGFTWLLLPCMWCFAL